MMIQQDKRKVNPLAGNVEAKGQRQAPREPEEKGKEEGKNSIVKKKKKNKGGKKGRARYWTPQEEGEQGMRKQSRGLSPKGRTTVMRTQETERKKQQKAPEAPVLKQIVQNGSNQPPKPPPESKQEDAKGKPKGQKTDVGSSQTE